jgi:hypothetical protein
MFVELISKCSVFFFDKYNIPEKIIFSFTKCCSLKRKKKTFSENFNSFENNIIIVEVAKRY